MVNSRNIAALVLAAVTMAGCIPSDHPIPPLDVGSGGTLLGMNATELTRASSSADFAKVAPATQTAYPQGDLTVTRMRMPSAPVGTSYEGETVSGGGRNAVTYADSSDVSFDERRGNAPQTLEAQAQRLEPAPAPAGVPAQTPPAQEIAAVRSGPARIALAEVGGVGIDAAQPLATRFGAQAKAHGLAFTSASDPTATHVMKGYFNVGESNGEPVVNYVWDISDLSGKRLHRIQGSEPAGGAGEGWAAVTPQAMEAVADKSIKETARFLGSQRG